MSEYHDHVAHDVRRIRTPVELQIWYFYNFHQSRWGEATAQHMYLNQHDAELNSCGGNSICVWCCVSSVSRGDSESEGVNAVIGVKRLCLIHRWPKRFCEEKHSKCIWTSEESERRVNMDSAVYTATASIPTAESWLLMRDGQNDWKFHCSKRSDGNE